ncbi:MAG: hypothetical protein QE273_10735 [Verrucomicrobiales bacterium]|nr:hypothetical protein [Verrucomicrobiales bacterium]
MKSFLKNLFLPVAGLALAATAATAAPWPPVPGDLILGVRATGGTGATKNVFFNLGAAHALRTSPSPAGTLVNLDVELTAAFGAGWNARTDLYFGVFANRSNATPSGIGSALPENGDPARTIYTSKGVTTAGTGTPWSGFSVSSLGLAATAHQGQINAIDNIAANSNNVMTLVQATNPVEWANSWSQYNPVPGAAYSIFTGGIQSKLNATAAHVDVFRIVGSTGSGSYVTTVSLAGNGAVTAARAGAAVKYYTITVKTANGSVSGAVPGVVYAAGSTVRLTAAPAAGYGFDTWISAPAGSPNPLNLVVTKNMILTAKFGLFPAVNAPSAESMTITTGVFKAEVTTLGNGRGLERGIIYSVETVNGTPVLGGTGVTKATISGGRGKMKIPVTGLLSGTTYAFRGFVTTNIGTSYSDVDYATTYTDTPLVGGTTSLTVEDRPIRVGKSQGFAITIGSSNLPNIQSTGLSSTSTWTMSAVKLDSRGKVIFVPIGTGTGNVAFTDPLTNGYYSLDITNSGTATETFDLTVDGSNVQNPRPDVSVGSTAVTATEGADVYSPTVQIATQDTREAKPRDFVFLLGNDGPIPDSMVVYATIGGRTDMFKTAYKVPGATPGLLKNITASLLTGRYRTPVLSSSDAPVPLSVRVSPNRADSRIVRKELVPPSTTKMRTIYGTETFNEAVTIKPVSDLTIEDSARMRLDTLAN